MDATKALDLDEHNVKAYLLCARAKGYIAVQGANRLITEALDCCQKALSKCKENSWSDGIEKSKSLRTKLRILQYNVERKEHEAQKSALLAYYYSVDSSLHSAILALLPAQQATDVPDYFNCLISLVASR